MKETRSVNRNVKIILGIVSGIAVICICVCVSGMVGLHAGFNTVDDPEKAEKIARSIVEYDLPAGYGNETVTTVFWVSKLIMIVPLQGCDSNQPRIGFIQVSETLRGDKEQMVQEFKQDFQSYYDMELVEEQKLTIRGQDTVLHVYEGTNDQGVAIKQIISEAFDGKKGFVMLIVEGPVQGWDQEMIDQFIKSIR